MPADNNNSEFLVNLTIFHVMFDDMETWFKHAHFFFHGSTSVQRHMDAANLRIAQQDPGLPQEQASVWPRVCCFDMQECFRETLPLLKTPNGKSNLLKQWHWITHQFM